MRARAFLGSAQMFGDPPWNNPCGLFVDYVAEAAASTRLALDACRGGGANLSCNANTECAHVLD